MRTVVRLEGTPEALTAQRVDNAAQTLDLLQNVKDGSALFRFDTNVLTYSY